MRKILLTKPNYQKQMLHAVKLKITGFIQVKNQIKYQPECIRFHQQN